MISNKIEEMTDEEKLVFAKRHLKIIKPYSEMEPNWWTGMRLLEEINHLPEADEIWKLHWHRIKEYLSVKISDKELKRFQCIRDEEEKKYIEELEKMKEEDLKCVGTAKIAHAFRCNWKQGIKNGTLSFDDFDEYKYGML